MEVTLVNITGFPIHFKERTLPPVGEETHLGSLLAVGTAEQPIGTLAGLPLYYEEALTIPYLPDPVPGVVYVATPEVAQAARRRDVITYGGVLRNERGVMIAARYLRTYQDQLPE